MEMAVIYSKKSALCNFLNIKNIDILLEFFLDMKYSKINIFLRFNVKPIVL